MAGILKVDTLQNSNASNIVTQTNTTTITIGTSGQTVALASGATSSGFGATYNGAVNWSSTVRTSGFTAVSGNGYFCNTTSAAFTVTLPATPAAGDIVAIRDYAQTFATNNLTVGRNSSLIDGQSFDLILSTNGIAVTLVYIDSTQGWKSVSSNEIVNRALYVTATGGTVLTCGNYKTHVFTTSGSFVVSCAGNSAGSNSVEYMVVAGGAAGGGDLSSTPTPNRGSGGGGAGGYRQNYPSPTTAGLPVTATTYPITVGAGGSANPSNPNAGSPGSNSIFSTITSAGGGGGGGHGNPVPGTGIGNPGLPGGSGGGGFSTCNAFGTGNTPPVTPPQGNNGGDGRASPFVGAGGGGAGAAGTNATPTQAGPGGVGATIATAFFGPTAPSYGTPGPAAGRYFAGGGGGAAGTGGAGGNGCGGAGGGGLGAGGTGTGVAGTTNTGGGGGSGRTGASGGSGIVVIRYKYQ
ncbi:hypothetical protein EBU71_07580 [bacterium]|nr:hypothetical protein [Candidatus Elulimicrobium humile]